MDKEKIKESIVIAAKNTHRKYRNFQGVIIFGSFLTEKENPSDIDLIPVLEKYDGSWHFHWISETGHEYDNDYYEYKKIENKFCSYFKDFSKGYDTVLKTAEKNGLIHIESLVTLDDLVMLKKELCRYGAIPKNFIGNEKASRIIYDLYK